MLFDIFYIQFSENQFFGCMNEIHIFKFHSHSAKNDFGKVSESFISFIENLRTPSSINMRDESKTSYVIEHHYKLCIIRKIMALKVTNI